MKNFIYTLIVVFSFLSAALAHSGRTDASGCHNDNKNGGYHCHKANTTTEASRTVSSEEKSGTVFFNQKSKVYHHDGCMSAKACTVNCIHIKKSEAIERGGRPCGICGG